MRGMVMLNPAKYVGGVWDPPFTWTGTDNLMLLFDIEGVHVRSVMKDQLFLDWRDVRALHVDGPDEIEKRVTLTRVALLGLGAFAIKKKSKQHSYVTVEGPDGPLYFEVKSKKGPFEIKGQLSEFERYVTPALAPNAVRELPASEPDSQLPPTTQSGGLGDQLKSLHELHQSGALSDREFEQAKARLLAD